MAASSSWEEIRTPSTETGNEPATLSPWKTNEATETSSKEVPVAVEDDYNDFYEAITQGDIKAVKAKLVSGMDLERKRDDGFTPLVISITEAQVTIARLLLMKGADVNHQVGTLPPMVYAVMKKQRAPRFIQLLIEHGADPNIISGTAQMNALHWAAEEGMVDATDFLISKGMDLNTPCSKGRTPLICAAEKGHIVIVKLLLAQGAELFRRSENGGTALIWAASNGHVDIVKYLIEEGINVDDEDNSGLSKLNTRLNLFE